MVDVAVAVVFDRGRFLAEKRREDERMDPGIVCLPGGHVKSKETKEGALVREMKEELGIEIKKLIFVKKSYWVASNGERQNLYYYLVLDYEGKPICKTAEKVLWLQRVEELDVEIDRQAVEESRALLQQAR